MRSKELEEKRKNRRKGTDGTQEFFTPEILVEEMLALFDQTIITDFSKTVLDNSAGNGNLLLAVLTRRLKLCKTSNDVYNAVKTIYGTELMQDNVEEIKSRFIMTIKESEIQCDMDKINSILNSNIICTDFFKWDYEKWKPIEELIK